MRGRLQEVGSANEPNGAAGTRALLSSVVFSLRPPCSSPPPTTRLFFLVVFAAAWSLRRWLALHHGFLLAVSYAFYGFWDWHYLSLLVCVSVFAAVVGAGAPAARRAPGVRKALVALGVTLALGTLGIFKYLGFLAIGAVSALELLGPARAAACACRRWCSRSASRSSSSTPSR